MTEDSEHPCDEENLVALLPDREDDDLLWDPDAYDFGQW